jgi:SHS family lactate transporter-like MFS transporter
MTLAAESAQVAWWKEPTQEQWHAWIAAWLGWTLDAFDFTIFLLIMLPISQSFNVPLVDVTAVLALTLWMRLVGATASGWLADRMGRKLAQQARAATIESPTSSQRTGSAIWASV